MADAANAQFQFLSNRPEPFGETDLFPEKSDENLWEVWEAIGFQSKDELGRFMGGLAKANEKEMLEVGRMLTERTKAGVPHPVCCTQMPPKKPVLMMRFQLEEGNQFGVHEPVPLMPGIERTVRYVAARPWEKRPCGDVAFMVAPERAVTAMAPVMEARLPEDQLGKDVPVVFSAVALTAEIIPAGTKFTDAENKATGLAMGDAVFLVPTDYPAYYDGRVLVKQVFNSDYCGQRCFAVQAECIRAEGAAPFEVHLLISKKLLGERPAVGDYIAGRFWLTASA